MVDATTPLSIEASADVVMDAPGGEAKKEKRGGKPKVATESEGSGDEDFNMREEGESDDQAESGEDDSEDQFEESFVAEVTTLTIQ